MQLTTFINDTFWLANPTRICDYANDTRIFACHLDLGTIIKQLEEDRSVIVKWFSGSFLKSHEAKWYLMIFDD